jgi:hypothetical protein
MAVEAAGAGTVPALRGVAMVSCDWVLMCDQVLVDNGRLSLINLFDRISAKSFPAQHMRCSLVAFLAGTPDEDLKAKGVLYGPKGEVVTEFKFREGKVGPTGHHYGILNIAALLLPSEGKYELRVVIGDHTVGTAGIEAIVVSDLPA